MFKLGISIIGFTTVTNLYILLGYYLVRPILYNILAITLTFIRHLPFVSSTAPSPISSSLRHLLAFYIFPFNIVIQGSLQLPHHLRVKYKLSHFHTNFNEQYKSTYNSTFEVVHLNISVTLITYLRYPSLKFE